MPFQLTHYSFDSQRLPVWDSAPNGSSHASSLIRPTVLFLHGWGLAPPAYRPLLTSLAHRHRVVAPYLPGLCENRPNRTYRKHADWADLVTALIAGLETNGIGMGTVHVVGQSTGGGIAAALAASQPQLLKSLTLIDASGLPSLAAKWPVLARMRELVTETGTLGVTAASSAMARSFVRSVVGGRGALMTAATVPLTEDLTSTFVRITAPTLILWGERDMLFPPATGEAMSQLIPGSKLTVIAGGWHSWEINRHAIAAALITDHIDAVSQPLPPTLRH